ncbi:MAG: hypothetical protein HYR84_14340 [Planctomycetes bacterium]|nr:hypothetical protein [Planctomycetota bacterium]
MFRAHVVCTFGFLLACLPLVAQDAGKEKGTPKSGDAIPRPFECLLINDTKELTEKKQSSKGRPHCMVCRFGLNPAVLIFAKKPADGKDATFTDLLKKLDEATLDFEDRNFQVGVVILSPDARDSTNNAKEADADKIIKETVNRQELIKRLTKRAQGLTNVLIGCYPSDGPVAREAPPKGFKFDAKMEMTVYFYERMKIIESFSFEAPPSADQVDATIKKIRDRLTKPPDKK